MGGLPYFYFNSLKSLDFGLYITEKNTYDSPSRDVTYESVPGRNGDLIIDNDRYNNLSVKYKAAIIIPRESTCNFDVTTSKIKNWLLLNHGYYTLYDSYSPDYFRYASCNETMNFNQSTKDVGSVEITFNCKPFKYSFEGQETITCTEFGTVENPLCFPSLPYIKIYGQGNVTLYVNSEAFNFKSIDEYIEIDSETMNAYKGSQLQNSKMESLDFPKFKQGENTVSWNGNVTKLEIIPRWCCL